MDLAASSAFTVLSPATATATATVRAATRSHAALGHGATGGAWEGSLWMSCTSWLNLIQLGLSQRISGQKTEAAGSGMADILER